MTEHLELFQLATNNDTWCVFDNEGWQCRLFNEKFAAGSAARECI